MALFNQGSFNKSVDDSKVIVKDFVRRAPFWSYRPAEYRSFDPLVQYKDEIDQYLEKIFTGQVDDANGNILDNMISDIVRQADMDLSRQRTDHEDTIKSFALRAAADKDGFESQANALQAALKLNQEEMEIVGKLMKKDEYKEVANHG